MVNLYKTGQILLKTLYKLQSTSKSNGTSIQRIINSIIKDTHLSKKDVQKAIRTALQFGFIVKMKNGKLCLCQVINKLPRKHFKREKINRCKKPKMAKPKRRTHHVRNKLGHVSVGGYYIRRRRRRRGIIKYSKSPRRRL